MTRVSYCLLQMHCYVITLPPILTYTPTCTYIHSHSYSRTFTPTYVHLGTALIRVGWHDVLWRPALKKAGLYVEPLPRILCTDTRVSVSGRKSKVRRHRKNAFMYLVAHQSNGEFFWNIRDTNKSILDRNPYPADSMMIGGVPPIYTRDKLCQPGTSKVLRPQENSLYEVSLDCICLYDRLYAV